MANLEAEVKTDSGPRTTQRQPNQAYGGDLLSSWCGIWSNMFISLGEMIAPQTCASGGAQQTSNRTDESSQQRGSVACNPGEFAIRWCAPGTSQRSTGSEAGTKVSGRYQGDTKEATLDVDTRPA